MSKTSKTKYAFPFGQKVAWKPNQKWIDESNLSAFIRDHNLKDYDDLFDRSISDYAWFWENVLKDLDIQFYKPYTKIVDLERGIRFPRWCVDGQMNIVHNCLDKWLSGPTAAREALRWEGEEGTVKSLTYGQLDKEVCRCANALRSLGLGNGDVIALYMPMIPELVIAFLAIIKIGGIILPLFSGYGPGAIIPRLSDSNTKAIFTSDGAWRRGKNVAMKSNIDESLKKVSSVLHVIVTKRTNISNLTWEKERDIWWYEMIDQQSTDAETEHTNAEDILMLIYTSGTTGKPKGAVHTHCGFPVKAAQDMYQCMDLKPADTMYWISDMGWMMGPWEVFGTLLVGAKMVFYDGASDFPTHERLWQQIEGHQITHLGVSPTLIRMLKNFGTEQLDRYHFDSLRMIGSTGSPWDPESWKWLFNNVLEGKKPILNYSGGTEISGGIICGNFFKPLKPCAFSGPVPGMDADVVDEKGQSVKNQVGELVIRKPWIGMTRGFWKDEKRYLETYWDKFKDIWVHGDFAAIDDDNLWYILGRSDDTIKVSGKRLGPAEVETILNVHNAVSESAAIGVPHELKGEEVVIFCVLKTGIQYSETLREELIQLVVSELGKPLRPKEVKFVTALPKTRNAKVMHRVIRAIYLDNDPGDLSSLENPQMIEAIKAAV
jgi:acetyl-CoA synthetase